MEQVCADLPRRRAARAGRARVALASGALGVVAFLVVVAVDGGTRRDGYDGTKHWISLLARGERAWVGSAALTAVAVATLAAAWGAARISERGPSRLSLWMAGVGASLSLAAAFPVDPLPSYPQGSPPASLSVVGALHSIGGTSVMVLLALVAWTGRTLEVPEPLTRPWRALSVAVVATVAACPVLAVAAVAVSGPSWEAARVGVFQRVALGAGLVWFAAVSSLLAAGAGHRRVVDLTDGAARSRIDAHPPA